jgi:hypothetical protein
METMSNRTVKPEFSSIPQLVKVLQRIHDGRRSRSVGPNPSPRSAIDEEQPGFADLLFGFADQTGDLERQLGSVKDPDADIGLDGPRRYQVLREELDRVEDEARRSAEIVERSMAQTARNRFSTGASFSQETLYLQCRRLGKSGGRFRCESLRERRTEVQALSGRFKTGAMVLPDQPQLVLRPDNFVLEAGESKVIDVEIDLSACANLAIGTLQASVDLLMNDAVAIKLWIEVEVYDVP